MSGGTRPGAHEYQIKYSRDTEPGDPGYQARCSEVPSVSGVLHWGFRVPDQVISGTTPGDPELPDQVYQCTRLDERV